MVICKRLSERMGGRIWAESKVGEGSRFHFSVKLKLGDAERLVPVATTHSRDAIEHLRGARILLVEDSEVNHELATELLRSRGIHVTSAWNGQEALETLQRESFDGILMDLQMPVMDGYSATQAIRKQPQYQELPIIAMTANVMSGDREKAEAAGMNDHIGKPVNFQVMFSTMARWITPKVAMQEVERKSLLPEGEGQSPDTPVIDGINVEAALKNISGDLILYQRVLSVFLSTRSKSVVTIKEALARGTPEGAALEAHTLKGVASTIGAEALYQQARALELALNTADNHSLEQLLAHVDSELQRVLEAVGNYCTQLASTDL